MIYRHYKGGLYYSVGFATRSTNQLPSATSKVVMARYTEATSSLESEPIPVWRNGDTFVYHSNFIDGVQVLYKNLEGQYWLRPIQMFFEEVNGEPRFKKIRGEELFDIVSNGIKLDNHL